MFNSLRSRLWLSYTLLIGITVMVVAVALVVSLLQNPAVYRQGVLPQLRLIEVQLMPRFRQAIRIDPASLQSLVDTEAKSRKNIRIAVMDESGNVAADSGKKSDGSLPVIDPSTYPHLQGTQQLGMLRDSRKKTWVFWTNDIGQSGYTLLVATTVPKLPLVQLLRNDVAAPLIWSGAVALLVAFLLAVGMGSWISNPLQRMVAASGEMASGKAVNLPAHGPQEVKDLARALNEMHRQVLVSQKAQRDFVANVSHELKTPLTSIQGFAQAILDGAVQTPDALRQAAGVIYSESNRMHRLVLDLLVLTRLEGGTADLQRDRVDLRELLNGVAAKFSLQATAAQVEFVSQLDVLPPILGDGDRLAQVFTNLVDNALKFTPAGGRVSITARIQDAAVLIGVSDNGRGIPSEDKERIFERFYQLDKSRKGGLDHGSGLGLAIARQIVLAHGGKIWVESIMGMGSQFNVSIPLIVPDHQTPIGKRK